MRYYAVLARWQTGPLTRIEPHGTHVDLDFNSVGPSSAALLIWL